MLEGIGQRQGDDDSNAERGKQSAKRINGLIDIPAPLRLLILFVVLVTQVRDEFLAHEMS